MKLTRETVTQFAEFNNYTEREAEAIYNKYKDKEGVFYWLGFLRSQKTAIDIFLTTKKANSKPFSEQLLLGWFSKNRIYPEQVTKEIMSNELSDVVSYKWDEIFLKKYKEIRAIWNK